jgi:hypothetical protein
MSRIHAVIINWVSGAARVIGERKGGGAVMLSHHASLRFCPAGPVLNARFRQRRAHGVSRKGSNDFSRGFAVFRSQAGSCRSFVLRHLSRNKLLHEQHTRFVSDRTTALVSQKHRTRHSCQAQTCQTMDLRSDPNKGSSYRLLRRLWSVGTVATIIAFETL